MKYGYARVSTNGQARDGNSLEAQAIALKAAGAERVYSDHFTGTKKSRPELDKLMAVLRDGDTLIFTKLDRVARSTTQGIEIINGLIERGITVHVLNMGVIDETPTGKLIRTIFFAFAEFERDMIVERTTEGKCLARQRPDFKEGRPTKNLDSLDALVSKQKDGVLTVTECCKILGISKGTWYNRLRKGA